MSTQIKYTNSLGSFITVQQQSYLNSYNKLTYLFDELKIIEAVDLNNNITNRTISYFLDLTEDKHTILNQYTSNADNTRCVLYSNKINSNGYDLWDWESYSTEALLQFKGKEVFDNKNRLILTCSFDLITNNLQRGAMKNYFTNQFNDESADHILQFEYNSNGDLELIFDVQEKFGYIEGISIETFLGDSQFYQVDFPWDEHPYYHSVLPYLPVGDL